MKKFTVSVPLDYIDGYLRLAHKEMIVEAESMEEAKQKVLDDKENFIDESDLILDDYEVNDFGDLDFDELEINESEE